MILLTTTLPKLYSQQFNFKRFTRLANGYWLMGL